MPGPVPDGRAVTVIVPARDEEHRIGPLLDALSTDPQVDEIVVVVSSWPWVRLLASSPPMNEHTCSKRARLVLKASSG